MFKKYRIFIAPSIFLFILPFTHTVTLRLSMLGIAFLTALYIWRKEETPSLPLKLPLILTALIAIASIFWAVDPGYSMGEVKNEIGYTFIAFFTFYTLTRSDKELRIFGSALLVGVVVMVSLGLGAYFMNGLWNETGYQGGVHDFCTYVVFMSPVLLFACYDVKRLWLRLVFFMLLMILIIAGYFTLQRIMWPGIAAVLLSLFLLLLYGSSQSRVTKQILGTVALSAAIIMLPIGIMVNNNVSFTSGIYDVIKNDPRVDGIWGASFQGIEQAPLLGVGYGRRSFYKAYPDLGTGLGWHTHNIILDKLVQTGFVGAILFIFLIASIIRLYWIRLRNPPSHEVLVLSACCIALVVGMLTVNMTNHAFVRHSSLLFWSLIGMSLGYSARVHKGAESKS